MEIRVSDLPEASRIRLLAAIKNPPPKTFIIDESKLPWAVIGMIAAVFGAWSILAAANDYNWTTEQSSMYLGAFASCSAIGGQSAAYVWSFFRSKFKAQFLVNPLYLVRFRFNRIEATPFTEIAEWNVRHLKGSNGTYSGTKFYFKTKTGRQTILKTATISATNALIGGLNTFPLFLSDVIEHRDANTLYSMDVLYEWRIREQQFPSGNQGDSTGFSYVVQRLGPALCASLLAAAIFFIAIQPYNNYCDDELRWNSAKTLATANAFRVYVASRPDGRHQSEAYAAVAKLYEGAADRYRNASRLGSSDGVEAVIKMLDYAKNSGRYKVFVDFTGDNEMPEDVEIRLKQLTGLPRLVPILPSFTGNMNRAREARILARISNSFGNVIPGDILQFVEGKPSSNDIGFEVGYVIQASGAMYYPGKQEQFPQAARDWYTGVNFTWAFVVDVPDTKSSKFQLKMKSEPAPVFQVMSSQNLGGSESLEPASVYSAMADSAFADFGSKLLAQLSLQ